MARVWKSLVARMDELCHIHEWVMSYIRMSDISHMDEARHAREEIESHIWTNHVTHMNESCRKCEWVVSHMWMRHVTHTWNAALHHMWDMTDSHAWRDSFTSVTWLIHKCDMTKSVTWLIHMLGTLHLSQSQLSGTVERRHQGSNRACREETAGKQFKGVFNTIYIYIYWALLHMCYMIHQDCGTWRIHSCDMTHIYVRHDSFIFLLNMWDMTHLHATTASRIFMIHQYGGVRRIYTCDMTHSYMCMWHDAFIRVTCLISCYSSIRTWLIHIVWLLHVCDNIHQYDGVRRIHMCYLTHSRMWHDSFMFETRHIHMCDMPHPYVCMWHDVFIRVTWLIHTVDITDSPVWHNSFVCVTWNVMKWSCHTYGWVMSHIWMSHVTHMNESCHTYE